MEILIIGVILVVVLSSIRQINEYERGIKFRFGKFKKIMNPGWNLIFPVIDSFKKVDIRTRAVDVPEQEAITKDNVSIKINAVLYYKIFDASKAILAVENFNYAVSQLAQTTMRNAVGSVSLDELLSERDKISSEICKIVDEATDPWGIKVENVELKDISSVMYDLIVTPKMEKEASEAESIDEWKNAFLYSENSKVADLDEANQNQIIECILLGEIERYDEPDEYLETWYRYKRGEVL